MDFAVLPPEVNSGRMYAGAGSGPLVAAAAAWAGLASELSAAAMSYQAEVDELTSGSWLGPSSTAMATAAAPYVTWMNTLAGQAQHSATQASAAAAAYDAAFTATVPPPIITANRTLLATLLASNIFGQNTPAIATTESHYAEMWAQDASAMYSYAGASSAAATLTPFSPAPQTTNPTQATTNTATNSVAHMLTSLASGAQATDPITSILDWLNGPLGMALNSFFTSAALPTTNLTGPMFAGSGVIYQIAPLFLAGLSEWSAAVHGVPQAVVVPQSALEGLGASLARASAPAAEVSALAGSSASLSGLSVPQSWGKAAPEIRLAAKPFPLAVPEGASLAAAAASPGGMVGGIPPVGSVVNAPRNGQLGPRRECRTTVMAQLPGENRARDGQSDRLAQSIRQTRDIAGDLSERERDELEQLRKEVRDAVMERDAAARLIKEAIRP